MRPAYVYSKPMALSALRKGVIALQESRVEHLVHALAEDAHVLLCERLRVWHHRMQRFQVELKPVSYGIFYGHCLRMPMLPVLKSLLPDLERIAVLCAR